MVNSNEEEPPRPKGLQIQSDAPMFETVDIYENPIILDDLLKTYDGVLIDFFRGNWWSHCKKHLYLLTENITEFESRNIKLISIASDSERLLKKFKEENNFAVDIISDRGAKIAKDYDVYWFAPGGGGTMNIKQAVPSKFLINKDRKIVWTYIGKDKTDRPSIKIITDIIEEKI